MRRLGGIVALILVAGGLTACTSHKDGPLDVMRKFIAGWAAGDYAAVPAVDRQSLPIDPARLARQVTDIFGDLDPGRLAWGALGPLDQSQNGHAKAVVPVAWSVTHDVVWSYDTTLDTQYVDKAWRLLWTPAVVNPALKYGESLKVERSAGDLPQRGNILDATGTPIVQLRPVVDVGIEPQRVTDITSLVAALRAAFASAGVDADLDDLADRVAAAAPDAFVEVVTLRREVYDQLRPKIYDLPGTVFVTGELPLAPTRGFARALLGTVGEVLADQLAADPDDYLAGDQVGHGGLQEAYDSVLRGGTAITIKAEPSDSVLQSFKAVTGADLATTLDTKVQLAAEAALGTVPQRSALVAIKVSDGSVLAVANGPDGNDLDLALSAQEPPGSTFKLVTALGLLTGGALTPETPVDCPASFTVGGRSFTNDGGFQLGSVPFRQDFAKSCNTAFASLAPQLGDTGLRDAGASLGLGGSWSLGLDTFTGSVPAGVTPEEAAAAAFGQGQTLVSPVALAAAVAAVARGSWLDPSLVRLPVATDGSPAPGAATAGPATGSLDADAVAGLRSMMRDVVTAGTATALAGVPGEPVYAKTGTAEYDNDPSHTHAWVVGWQGDIAFAVFVEDGGESSVTAVPIAASFLSALAG